MLVLRGVLSLPGFGIFKIRYRSARTARNPMTSEELKIAHLKLLHQTRCGVEGCG